MIFYFYIFAFYFIFFPSVLLSFQIHSNLIQQNNFLTKEQWLTIKKILYLEKNKPIVSNEYQMIKKKIQTILFVKYENIAYWKAYQFKKYHSYKCSHISLLELSLYSKMGLYKAIQNYKPEYDFYSFLNLYMNSELLKGLTELYPICAISKCDRVKKKDFLIKNKRGISSTEKKALFVKRNNYKKKMNTKFIGKEDWLIDKNCKKDDFVYSNILERENYEELWNKINSLRPIQKLIFQLKYDFYLNKIRSNIKISELLGYSEEFVRLQLHLIYHQILHL